MNPLLDLRILAAVTPKKSVLWEADPYFSAIYNQWMRPFDDFMTGDYASAYLRLQRLARDLTAAGRQDVSRVPAWLLWYRGLAAAHVFKHDEAIADMRELVHRAEDEEDPSRLTYMPLEPNTYRSVLAASPEKLRALAGQGQDAFGPLGPFAGRLSNGGGTLHLEDRSTLGTVPGGEPSLCADAWWCPTCATRTSSATGSPSSAAWACVFGTRLISTSLGLSGTTKCRALGPVVIAE